MRISDWSSDVCSSDLYAGGTRFQKEAGFEDNAEQMYSYLSMEVGDIVRPETLRRYCDESAANLEWLIAHGVPYASAPYLDKTIYTPDGKFLYYSGNEKVPEYAARAAPAPRAIGRASCRDRVCKYV